MVERTWGGRVVRAWGAFWWRVGRAVPERVWVWWVLTRMVWSRAYPAARYAVRKVAGDHDLYATLVADPHGAKLMVADQAASYPNMGENLVRMNEAREWMGHWLKEHGRRCPAVMRNGLVEAAYLAYRARGR